MRSLKNGEFYGFYRTSAEYLALTSRPNRLHSDRTAVLPTHMREVKQ